jgi:FkbM family methyltransferase
MELAGAKKLVRSLIVFAPRLQGARFRAEARFVRAFRRPYRPEFAGLRALSLENPLVLDIGCNRGISIETILAMRPDARVIGFEANSLLAADTRRWFAAESRVEIHPFGLGSLANSIEIHVPRYRNYRFDGLGSFDRSMAERLIANDCLYWFDPQHLHTETIESAIKRLDDLKLRPDVMKLYVQGYEEQVLEGATETISSSEPVILAPSGRPDLGAKLLAKGYGRFQWSNGCFVPDGDGDFYVDYYMTPSRLKGLGPGLLAKSRPPP